MGDGVTGLANATVVCCLPQSQVEAGEYKDVISSLTITKSVLPLGVRRPQVGGPCTGPALWEQMSHLKSESPPPCPGWSPDGSLLHPLGHWGLWVDLGVPCGVPMEPSNQGDCFWPSQEVEVSPLGWSG